ncbi:S-adenosyl-L-methionine-dependent methyltransferase [Parasponia andersonii]|uniref:S-adenosyl-L-methionine-dependent methyltransferase n=1 Tax=Parasponia andersonii TaxID=3476 RepID=A0A2P5C5E1_PARAD|nr:S-adenosyl-L-methionine-dependent methyltransferase [Parasponia andersonii]
MSFWSAENATKAYLKTLKMGQKPNEPDEVEFISAIAAGNNAQLMVVACAGTVDATALALVTAANQTGGRVVCILRGNEELDQSEELILGLGACHVEFVIGDAQNLLLTHYREADFVLVDCNLEKHQEGILRAVQILTVGINNKKQNGAVFVGYNAFRKGYWRSNNNIMGLRTQLLPIGEGLLVTRRIAASNYNNGKVGGNINGVKRSHSWVVKVDKCTGEEHVFRVRSFPHDHGRQIEA